MGFAERYLRLRIVTAEPEKILTQLTHSGVELLDVLLLDYLTVEIQIRKRQVRIVQNMVNASGGTCRMTGKRGLLWNVESLWRRPVLTVGFLLFCILGLFANNRIFFVKVQGNELLSDRLILAEAEKCGITFGAKASEVRSEDVKNQLIKQLPQLQWLGVTTAGAVATVQVQERTIQSDLIKPISAVSHIIASQDGVISEMTVYKGTPVSSVGQSVQAGDLLVSGYSDCGIIQKAERAEGEVFAYTNRRSQFCTLYPTKGRETYIGSHICYRIRIGKKVINLCNHSGIPDATCVKIYSEEYWTLPGDFRLPVSIIKVQTYSFRQKDAEFDPQILQTWLPQFAGEYVHDQMIAGEILNEQFSWVIGDQVCMLDGEFACHEMIGQVKDEEIIGQNAEDN